MHESRIRYWNDSKWDLGKRKTLIAARKRAVSNMIDDISSYGHSMWKANELIMFVLVVRHSSFVVPYNLSHQRNYWFRKFPLDQQQLLTVNIFNIKRAHTVNVNYSSFVFCLSIEKKNPFAFQTPNNERCHFAEIISNIHVSIGWLMKLTGHLLLLNFVWYFWFNQMWQDNVAHFNLLFTSILIYCWRFENKWNQLRPLTSPD